jgi:hypothetical protein
LGPGGAYGEPHLVPRAGGAKPPHGKASKKRLPPLSSSAGGGPAGGGGASGSGLPAPPAFDVSVDPQPLFPKSPVAMRLDVPPAPKVLCWLLCGCCVVAVWLLCWLLCGCCVCCADAVLTCACSRRLCWPCGGRHGGAGPSGCVHAPLRPLSV